MAFVDPIVPILKLLESDSAITTLTDSRIWAGYRQPPESAQYKPAHGAAIVFELDGGQGNYGHTIQSPRYMVKCYGCDRIEAQTLFNTVADLLFSSDRTGDRMGQCVMACVAESAPIGRREPDTDWPHVLFFMRARMKAREI